MAIDPAVNIARASQLYNQAQTSGVATDTIPSQDDGQSVGKSGFSGLLENYLSEAQKIGQKSENLSIAAVTGKADLTQVATAVSDAEITLQTVVAVRDKVIDAYKEILRMPM